MIYMKTYSTTTAAAATTTDKQKVSGQVEFENSKILNKTTQEGVNIIIFLHGAYYITT